MAKLETQKKDLQNQVQNLNERVQAMEDQANETAKQKRAIMKECEEMKKGVGDLEMTIRKAESEKQALDHQCRSIQVTTKDLWDLTICVCLQDELAGREAVMTRLSKEKKQHEDVNRKLTEDLQAEEDKINHLNKIKAKLEQSIDALEGEIESEKHARQVQFCGFYKNRKYFF